MGELTRIRGWRGALPSPLLPPGLGMAAAPDTLVPGCHAHETGTGSLNPVNTLENWPWVNLSPSSCLAESLFPATTLPATQVDGAEASSPHSHEWNHVCGC